jgi:hypothetical protein
MSRFPVAFFIDFELRGGNQRQNNTEFRELIGHTWEVVCQLHAGVVEKCYEPIEKGRILRSQQNASTRETSSLFF